MRPLHSAVLEKENEKKGQSCHHLRYMFWLLSLLFTSTGQVASIPIVSVIVNRSITFGWLSSFEKSIILGFCGELVDCTGYFSVEVWISSNPLQMCCFLVHSWHWFLEESPLPVAVDCGVKNEHSRVFFVVCSRNIVPHLANVKSQNAPSECWKRDIKEKIMVDDAIVWAQGNLDLVADGLLAMMNYHTQTPLWSGYIAVAHSGTYFNLFWLRDAQKEAIRVTCDVNCSYLTFRDGKIRHWIKPQDVSWIYVEANWNIYRSVSL